MKRDDRPLADRYLISYQKTCLFPVLYALVSLFTTFLLYANKDFSLALSFYVIRLISGAGLETHYLWLIGFGIGVVFVFPCLAAAKGRVFLLLIPGILILADLIVGLILVDKKDVAGLFLSAVLHVVFLIGIVISFVLATKTKNALAREKRGE